MEESHRRRLQRGRLRLVEELRVEPLWALMLRLGVFSPDMIEEIQQAGTRREQARQLIVDLETRGSRAFPAFLWCLQESGQAELASWLREGLDRLQLHPANTEPADVTSCTGPSKPRSDSWNWIRGTTGVTARCGRQMEGHGVIFAKQASWLISMASWLIAMMIATIWNWMDMGRGGSGLRGYQGTSTLEKVTSPVQVANEEFQQPKGDAGPAQGSEKRPRRNSETVYVLNRDPCGYCLIINNVNFNGAPHLRKRDGSNVDCEKLALRFKSLHFEVLTRQDLREQEIVRELQNLSRRDHSAYDCCVVVLLSHGCQTRHIRFPGGVYGTDGRGIAVEKIVSYFDGNNCPSLRGKPKLFFIQACGGEEKDQGFQIDSESPAPQVHESATESDATPFRVLAGGSDQPDAVASLPTPSDILVSYSTFPGFVSWRHKSKGSWYIEKLDEVLGEYAGSEDLLDMLLRVGNAVSEKGIFKQMPGYFNFLRKKFFFMV